MEFSSERAVGLSTSPSLKHLPARRTLAGFMRLSASRRSAPSALRHEPPLPQGRSWLGATAGFREVHELPDEARKPCPKDRPAFGWPLIGHPEPSEVG